MKKYSSKPSDAFRGVDYTLLRTRPVVQLSVIPLPLLCFLPALFMGFLLETSLEKKFLEVQRYLI